MSEPSNPALVPTEIKLHRKRRELEIAFAGGERFNLSCEYLREFSPAVAARASREPGGAPVGKERVTISAINPLGAYAVRLVFADGHDTGVYFWETLYELGRDYGANWGGPRGRFWVDDCL